MDNMTSEQEARCHAIIHIASAGAAGVGAGLAQIPLSDNAIITPIQLTMTISLGQVFGIEMDRASAKAVIASAAGAKIGRATSQYILGWIPGFGNVINASTTAAVTEGLGWTIAADFARKSS